MGTILHAQDIKTASDFYTTKLYEKAKTAIDAAIAKSPEDVATLIWKHQIYYAIGTSSTLSLKYKTALIDGVNALTKAMEKPKADEEAMKIIGINYLNDFTNYYTAFINNGSTLLDKQKFNEAYNNFNNALNLSNHFI